jgi:hypothetical protein
VTPPTYDAGMQGWAGNSSFDPAFNNSYSGVATVQSLPHGVPINFNTTWTDIIPAPALSSAPFLETTFRHAPPPNTARAWSNLPQLQPNRPLKPPPSPENKRAPFQPKQQPSKRPKPLNVPRTTTTTTAAAASPTTSPLSLPPSQDNNTFAPRCREARLCAFAQLMPHYLARSDGLIAV